MICDGFSKGILPAFCVEVIETSTGIKNDTDKTSVLSSSHLCLNVCSTHCLFLEINVIFWCIRWGVFPTYAQLVIMGLWLAWRLIQGET